MRLFFSTACEFPRGTWRAPAPTPPPCLPGAAGSSGHGLGGPRCTPGQSGALPPAHPVWSDVLAEDLPPRPASVLPPGTAAWYGTPYPQTCPAPPRCASPPSPYLPLAEYGPGQPFALGSFPANQSFQLVSFFPFQPDHIPFSSHGCHPPTSTLLKKGSNLRRFLKQLPKPS